MSKWATFWHYMKHIKGSNTGEAYTWTENKNNSVMVGFKCKECGSIEGIKRLS